MLVYQKALVSFSKIREIGEEGRNSQVFLAHDEYLDADIVIKEVDKIEGNTLDDFFEEARTLYLSNHPNVVQINYACEDNEKVYIAMPYYEKGSLKKLINTKFLTTREIIRYSVQMLNGLHNIHSKGLIHFDLKPDNILISDRNEALVSDFGLTKAINELGTALPNGLYNKHVPPEYFTGTGFTYKVDIYQIGLTMYRICVGNEVFDNELNSYIGREQDFVNDVLRNKFPNRKVYPAHIPKKLRTTINKCLKANPTERFDSALEIINSIADIEGKILDWEYDLEDGFYYWRQITDNDYKKILKVCTNGTAKAYKTNSSLETRRISAYCKNNITEAEIISFLES